MTIFDTLRCSLTGRRGRATLTTPQDLRTVAWHDWSRNAAQGVGERRDQALLRLHDCVDRGAAELYLDDLNLTSLPETLPPGLSVVSLRGNRLTAVPPAIGALGAGVRVHMEDNPLDAATIHGILFRAIPVPDIRITYPRRVVSDALGGSAPLALINRDAEPWRTIAGEDNAPLFFAFVDRLALTINWHAPASVPGVAQWLARLARDDAAELRQQIFLVAQEATHSCSDRVALSYNQMKSLSLAADVEGGAYDARAADLLQLARGMFRLGTLEQIAQEWTRTVGGDAIEIYLAYQVMLRDVLGLPVDTTEMLHFPLSGMGADDLGEAAARVLEAERTGFRRFLATDWAPWQRVLARWDAGRYDAARGSVVDAMGERFTRALDARMAAEGLPTDHLETRVRLGAIVARDLEYEIMGKLTEAYLEEHRLDIDT